MLQSHRELKVWQSAMSLVQLIYELSAAFPEEETFGLKNQIRRAAISIPSNIAEGLGSNEERTAHLYIALGALATLETQLEISKMLGYVKGIEIIEENMKYTTKAVSKLIKELKKEYK
ncbi:four helix bundle protein [Arachidicoccus sp.]|uniref:four helix bundle protein n=1 Tax=Arachidicoccus sp. TaxID=1872624 RepID=UPI003D19A399